MAQVNDRACPVCSDPLSLVQLGAESADRWLLIHNSNRTTCTWLTSTALTDSVASAAGVAIAIAKNPGHSKQR